MSIFRYHPLILISFLLLGVGALKLIIFACLSSRHNGRQKHYHPTQFRGGLPFVSIIVPCYNEELTLTNCIDSLLGQTYPCYEIIIVDDGSSDGTAGVIRQLVKKHSRIRGIIKRNGGKASALNRGIASANGGIVVCIDADSMFLPSTVRELVLSFESPGVVAVGGNVRVINRRKALGRQQALEYITGLTLQRRSFAHLGCMQVISGAIGAFRKDKLEEVGCYSTDTIVEDMDLTIELARRGYEVVYNPYAIAYTEAPENIRDFIKQRYRWTFGGFQVAAKHKDILFHRHHNRLGMIGLPYFVIFPWVDVLVSAITAAAILQVVITRNIEAFLLFFAAMTAVQIVVAGYALTIDNQSKKLAFMAGLDNLFYNHVISFTTLWAGINFLRGKKASWAKLRRYGKNTMPIAQPLASK